VARQSQQTAWKPAPARKQQGVLYRALRCVLAVVAALYLLAALGLFALRSVNPPFTAVHIERRVQSWFHKTPYHKRYTFVPLDRISLDFQHAVIAAEDSRFYQHHGFDWEEVRNAIEEEQEDGRLRGASTITQQLVKNLFLSTRRSFVRKGFEYTLVPLAERILHKRRILELYMNVIEWGPGVYGAEAAAQYHYGVSAARVNREQGARLAAILPSPLKRKPARMNEYSARILERMDKMGW
jgi:monofunctional biosynthetic peptidoglycan transglycosylase